MTKVKDKFYGEILKSVGIDRRYFSEYHTLDPDGWLNIMQQLKMEAEDAGYTNVSIGFESTLEPYEDYMLGPVCMFAEGYRDKTPEEVEQDLHQEKVHKFAKDRGCTPYEAKQFFELQAKGLV